jgi:hypothetical protein
MTNKNIQVIEDNSGGLTIQNTETKCVCYFNDLVSALESLHSLLDGDDIGEWDLSEWDCFITEAQMTMWGYYPMSNEEIEEMVSNLED